MFYTYFHKITQANINNISKKAKAKHFLKNIKIQHFISATKALTCYKSFDMLHHTQSIICKTYEHISSTACPKNFS